MTDDFTIHFKRTGGFTGIPIDFKLLSNSLTREECDKLIKLIDNSGISNFEPGKKVVSKAPDQFEYSILIEGYVSKPIEFSESEIPESLKPLIHYLVKKARR